MITLGIDPGLATVGFAVIEGTGPEQLILDFGTIQTSPDLLQHDRLLEIHHDISQLLQTHHPDHVFVEELFFSKNVTTALSVAEARGAILMSCAQSDASIHSITPNQVKVGICGDGSADKRQVQEMVQLQFQLSTIPQPDDAADALAIAYVGAVSIQLS